MNTKSQFTSNYNKGFSMTFENGLRISVQFGCGNYCANQDLHKSMLDHMQHTRTESPNAEIAIWDTIAFEDEDGTLSINREFNFGNDTVQGWVSTNDVAEWIYTVSQAKDMEDLYSKATQFKMIPA